MKAKILIVDDHEIVREGVRNLLARLRPHWTVCGEAASGAEGVKAVEALRPDLVVLDITMPDLNGLDAAVQVTRMGLGCRILMFTMHESARLADEVRNVGAHGYVIKSQAARDLVLAIDRLLEGGTFFSEGSEPEVKKNSRVSGMNLRASLALSWA
jgi:DNA-binding NarL/FixJ family response regulator